MQLVNNTEDTIVLDPGEGITFSSTNHEFDGDLYRITVEGGIELKDVEELMDVGDFIERRNDFRREYRL